MQIPEKRIAEYESLGFGLFMHWGLYSLLGKGEWNQYFDKTPPDEYARMKERFTAAEFRPGEIAALARQAGMRYIVLTTRHHEGFSLYDTRGLSDFDAPHSAAGRDLVAEFAEACREEDILPFFYHTTVDWHNPDYKNDFPAYRQFLRESVEVLCRNYGRVGGFWFDGNWDQPGADWREGELYAVIRKYQPDAIIVNNPGWRNPGVLTHPEVDVACFEQGNPQPLSHNGEGKYVAGEMCQTINGHWGCGRKDFRYKSIPELIKTLCACRRAGANYLLNVGPDAQGALPPLACEMLRTLGEWISPIAKPFYEGRPTSVSCQGDDFVLQTADGRLFLFVTDLQTHNPTQVTLAPEGIGPRACLGIQSKIGRAQWLDNGRPVEFFQDTEAGLFSYYARGFDYGCDTVVRVAELIPG